MNPLFVSGTSEKPRASPKSQIFNSQSAFTSKLPGFKSRCKTFAEWIYLRPIESIRNLDIVATFANLIDKELKVLFREGLLRTNNLMQISLHQILHQKSAYYY